VTGQVGTGPAAGRWDVIVVGGGPAGMSAALAAATAGASTLVLEKAEHPRYKTCGGGLIGASLASLPAPPPGVEIPIAESVDTATFSLDGQHAVTRRSTDGPLVQMVSRPGFDLALARVAEAAGAQIRSRATVRGIEPGGDGVRVTLAGGEVLEASTVVGADGSSGITSRHVGVRYDQVDLGLEVELPVSPALAGPWRGRLLIDWGPIPGSYGWVFPKQDVLTVGVIAARGQGEQTKRYLRDFLDRLGLSGLPAEHDSGHLTRCRTDDSPLYRGPVLVAGDAAGLLEPWTREGISYALRSGALAGAAAAAGDPAGYADRVEATLAPAMRAGRQLSDVFTKHPRLFHTLLTSRPGWHLFARYCRGQLAFESVLQRPVAKAAMALLR
jgi:geranylgeranyl reductase family protein